MRRLLILLTVVVAQAIPAVAESREKDLDRWLDNELIPYVQQQLQKHPRFRNETVMFVVLRDNAPPQAMRWHCRFVIACLMQPLLLTG